MRKIFLLSALLMCVSAAFGQSTAQTACVLSPGSPQIIPCAPGATNPVGVFSVGTQTRSIRTGGVVPVNLAVASTTNLGDYACLSGSTGGAIVDNGHSACGTNQQLGIINQSNFTAVSQVQVGLSIPSISGTTGTLVCVSGTALISCPFSGTQIVGVFQAGGSIAVVNTGGYATVNLASASVTTLGDYACGNTVGAGTIVDNGTASCASGQQAGFIGATNSTSVASVPVYLTSYPYNPIASGVASLNGLNGILSIAAGQGISVTPSGSSVTVADSVGLGNGYTVVDVSLMPGAPNATTMFNNALAICAGTPCILDGRGLLGSYTLCAFVPGQTVEILFPGWWADFTCSTDTYQPMINIATPGNRVALIGDPTKTQFYNNTPNDTILVSDYDGSGATDEVEIDHFRIQGPGGCGFSNAIDVDSGLIGSGGPSLQLHDFEADYSNFAIRTMVSYVTNIDFVNTSSNCTSLKVEGGIDNVSNSYMHTNNKAGAWIGSIYHGTQFVAGQSYQPNQYVMPRSNQIGYIFQVQAGCSSNCISDYTPPAWCSTLNCTVTSNGLTFKAKGTWAWPWWPGYTYVIGDQVTTQPINGYIYTATTGGTSCAIEPVWNTGSPTSETLCTTTLVWGTPVAATGKLVVEPTTVSLQNIDFEFSNADVINVESAGALHANNVLGNYDRYGVTIANGANNSDFTGSSFASQNIVSGVAPTAGLYSTAAGRNFTFNSTSFVNDYAGGSGIGIDIPCVPNGGGSSFTFTNVAVTGWTSAYTLGSGCNAGQAPMVTVNTNGAVYSSGQPCTNGEIALSSGWGSGPAGAASAVAGTGANCSWTITAGSTPGASPTVTDTLTTVNPLGTGICPMTVVGGTGAPAFLVQTTISGTAPVWTFQGTPTGADTYIVARSCN